MQLKIVALVISSSWVDIIQTKHADELL